MKIQGKKVHGRIAKICGDGRYCFVAVRIFLHGSELHGAKLETDQWVEFEVELTPRGLSAIGAKPINPPATWRPAGLETRPLRREDAERRLWPRAESEKQAGNAA